jgi:hypothetical protein
MIAYLIQTAASGVGRVDFEDVDEHEELAS